MCPRRNFVQVSCHVFEILSRLNDKYVRHVLTFHPYRPKQIALQTVQIQMRLLVTYGQILKSNRVLTKTIMDVSKFRNGRVHIRESGEKWLTNTQSQLMEINIWLFSSRVQSCISAKQIITRTFSNKTRRD